MVSFNTSRPMHIFPRWTTFTLQKAFNLFFYLTDKIFFVQNDVQLIFTIVQDSLNTQKLMAGTLLK
jgi:hypothetical protein